MKQMLLHLLHFGVNLFPVFCERLPQDRQFAVQVFEFCCNGLLCAELFFFLKCEEVKLLREKSIF